MSTIVEYRVDANDRIVWVGGAWDTFARENRAPQLMGTAVVGHALRSFIAGEAPQLLILLLLQSARALGRPLARRYRCDSTRLLREMEMTLSPELDGSVLLSHRLLRVALLPRPLTLRGSPNSAAVRCSVCSRIRQGDAWLAPEAHELDIPESGTLRVEHAVCAGCMEGVGQR